MNYIIAASLLVLFIVVAIPIIQIIILHYDTKALEKYLHREERKRFKIIIRKNNDKTRKTNARSNQ